MSLSAVVLPKKSVRVGETAFDVRGLSFHDISDLMTGNQDDLVELVTMYVQTAEQGEDPMAGGTAGVAFLQKVVHELPSLVAKVVAIAADEPDSYAVVEKMPFPAQLEAILAVGQMTFEDEDGLKKFGENILTLLAALTSSVPSPTASD